MKVIVFGATGFVGKNVIKILDEASISFVGASRRTGYDLTDVGLVTQLLGDYKPDFIVNCAAHVGSLNYVTEQAADIIVDNSKMIIGMYEAVSKASPATTVINPIANCAYPAKSDTFIEDYWWDGHLHRSVLSYGASRRFLWSVGECFSMQYGVRTISLLVPNMYGPYDSSDPNKAHALNALISKFVKAKYSKQSNLEIWGTGVAIREWLYAEDFAYIVKKIVQNSEMLGLDEPVNIAQNFGLSVRELVSVIKSHFIDYDIDILFDGSKPDGAPKKVMDDKRFRKVFKDFEFTKFNNGIEKTIEYYESIYPY
jgi:GDP-L-fucose synthase